MSVTAAVATVAAASQHAPSGPEWVVVTVLVIQVAGLIGIAVWLIRERVKRR